ncbi:peptidoglycan-binding protein [Geodermatophilus sp. DF01-2]|uniref:peptidoglycan-binding domain-containing protein n=1 Tax=Geodermatophilus sp. DF01-2 TaxID=2559610 RepID=UPI001073A93A|nr:peptidoglycan-binding domain-containing protein [Geodermatophilus sp. DF01_2]TFV63627.1 peptidoglycan-binding protein [Geodermatophilus sp. DF01_2]
MTWTMSHINDRFQEESPSPAVVRRSRALTVLVITFVLLAVASCATSPSADRTSHEAQVAEADWMPVTSGDIVTSRPFDGTVTRPPGAPVYFHGTGTVTAAPALESLLEPGDVAIRVDDHPVVVLPGDVPVFRDITRVVTTPEADPTPKPGNVPTEGAPEPDSAQLAPGNDIRQLQSFLASAGYFSGAINGRFSDLLGRACNAWRLDNGLSSYAGFRADEIVFLPGPGPWAVASTDVSPGQSIADSQFMSVTQGAAVVTVDLDRQPEPDVTYAALPVAGDASSEVPLTILGPATQGDNGPVQLLGLPDGVLLQPGASLVVEQRRRLAVGVTLVPIGAIRVDGRGDTFVRCRNSGQTEHDCPVSLGAHDSANAAVLDGLRPGQEVAVPA